MAHILLVEDSLEAQFLARRAIEKNNNVELATSLYEAGEKIKAAHFDLIILDVTLPDGNGMDYCKQLEREGVIKKTPVIMLTAKGDINDKVQGLSAGADDYIAKPFDSRELLARVDSVLRRRGINTESEIEIGPLLISLVEQRAFRNTGAGEPQPIDLTPIEFKILLSLARKSGDTVTREELFESVWGKGIHLSVRNIDTHVCKLRQKLGIDDIVIRSSRGKGYVLQLMVKKSPEIRKPAQDLILPQGAL